MAAAPKITEATTAEVIETGKRGYEVGAEIAAERAYGTPDPAYALETAKAFMDAKYTTPVVKAAAHATPPFYGRCATKAEALTFLARRIEAGEV